MSVLKRNHCPFSSGITVRFAPEWVSVLLQILQNRVKRRIREDSKNIYKKPILFRDTYFTNNTLYLLFYGDYDQHPFANQIAVINVVNNNLYFKKVYNLKTEEGIGSFSSICVINNKIVAFDVLSGKLLIYNIIKN